MREYLDKTSRGKGEAKGKGKSDKRTTVTSAVIFVLITGQNVLEVGLHWVGSQRKHIISHHGKGWVL